MVPGILLRKRRNEQGQGLIIEHRDGRAPGLVLAAPSCTEGSASSSQGHGGHPGTPALRQSLVMVLLLLAPREVTTARVFVLRAWLLPCRQTYIDPAPFPLIRGRKERQAPSGSGCGRGHPHPLRGRCSSSAGPHSTGGPHPFCLPVSRPEEALAAHLCVPLPFPLPMAPPGSTCPLR